MSNKARWRNFSKEEIEDIVRSSRSNAEVARKLGYSAQGGGTMQSIHKMYEEYHLDTSHMTHQGWNKGTHDTTLLTENSYKKRGKSFAKILIDLRGQKCECCGLTEWLNQPINLQVHHINGDRTDNCLENLQLLCPNCHSYTPNFCSHNKKRFKSDEEFVEALCASKSIREALLRLDLKGSGSNYNRAYHLIYEYNIEHLKKERASEQETL